VHAFDFDPEAVRIARGNARRNRESNRIQFLHLDVSKLSARASKNIRYLRESDFDPARG